MDNKLKIINHLGKHYSEGFTMHELSKLLEIPYATFYRVIQEIDDLICIEQIGKAKTLQLNRKNSVIKAYLTIASEEEKKEYLTGQPIINKITNELNKNEVVVLFGSYAKKTQTRKSDVDLLVINKKGNKTLSFSKYELLFKKKINPIFITNKEFKKMLQEKEENVSKQALKHHVILNNPESFWELVLSAV